MSKSRIVIRMGAAHNQITVDGRVIDRSSLDKGADRMMRGIIVGALKKDGYFNQKESN